MSKLKCGQIDGEKLVESIYGFGQCPPYSLYEKNDKWGLVDGEGHRLPAVFRDLGNGSYSSVQWEVVTFDKKEGFVISAWYDPFEVWFNFTFDNPDYPSEYGSLLWMSNEHKLDEYAEEIYSRLPKDIHWLIKILLQIEELQETDDEEDEDEDADVTLMKIYLSQCPELRAPAKLNPLIEPIMSNSDIDINIRKTLWRSKVALDYLINYIIKEG